MQVKLSQAVEGFLLDKEVAGLSPYSLRNYRLTLGRFCDFLGDDPLLRTITTDQIRRFLRNLQTTQLSCAGIAPRPARQASPKTILNAHVALSSFWTWAIQEGAADEHIVRDVDPPKPALTPIVPLSRDEVKDLLEAVEYGSPWSNQPRTRSKRPKGLRLRDRAIILFLLDTGVRTAELCDLLISDIDLRLGMATVRGKARLASGRGKKRVVYFGKNTRKALWNYVSFREVEPSAPLFAGRGGKMINRRHLAKHVKRLGERAGVNDVYPHRFRHTFAISYLRNGGDVFTLQAILGHSTLTMVRRYLAIAEADCADAHRRAGPVDNWSL